MKRRRGALPNLIVIGAARCGTTSLHNYLSQHPEIWMSANKELRFFVDRPSLDGKRPLRSEVDRATIGGMVGRWSRGPEWYRSQFDASFPVRGESSPQYSVPWFPEVAERMARVVPDAKLIYLVRDPVERAISNYRGSVAAGFEPRAANEALSAAGGRYAAPSRYAECLEPFLARFPVDRILILETEELGGPATMARVFGFLGVDESFRSPWFERRWNPASLQRGVGWRALHLLRRTPAWEPIVSRTPARARWIVERLTHSLGAPEPGPELSPEARASLQDDLRDDAARFRELTGRAFSSWQV